MVLADSDLPWGSREADILLRHSALNCSKIIELREYSCGQKPMVVLST